jgi:hypothetical protein
MREGDPEDGSADVRTPKINQTNRESAPLFGTSVAFKSQAYRSARDAVSSGANRAEDR